LPLLSEALTPPAIKDYPFSDHTEASPKQINTYHHRIKKHTKGKQALFF